MAENLLGNASFEFDSDANGLADGLTTFGTLTATRPAAIGTGSFAQQLVVAAAATADVRFVPFPISASTSYSLSVLARVTALSAAANFVFKVEWLDGTNAVAGYDYTVVSAVDATPVRRSFASTSPATAVTCRLIFAIEGGGTVILDDAQLETGGTATAYTEPNADWIIRAVLTAADGTNAAGAIGWYIDRLAVRPYEASFAAVALAAAYRQHGVQAYRDAVWGWLTWYATNQESDGTLWDYKRTGGAVIRETVAVPAVPSLSQAPTGGALGAGTYSYRITATNATGSPVGETTVSPAASTTVTSGTTNRVVLTWTRVTLAYGYRIYGRTGGTYGLIATVGDVDTYADTGGVTPGIAAPGTNTAYFRDSTDSYAGLFLLACRAASTVDPDPVKLAALATAIGKAVDAVELTLDTDGLTWAKPEFRVKYLMDQVETEAGLRAAASLGGGLLADAALAARAGADHRAIRAGVETLWNTGTPTAAAYDWAKHDSGARTVTAWAVFADALQQAWAAVFQITTTQTRLNTLITQFNTSQPTWDEPATTARYDPLPAVALRTAGAVATAEAGIAAIHAAAITAARAWDFNPMKAGWIVLYRTNSQDLLSPPSTTATYSAYSNVAQAQTPSATYSAYSNIANATTPPSSAPVPNAPSGLSATASGQTAIVLAWTDNSTDETGFSVERSVSGGGFTQLVSLAANTTGHTDTPVSVGVSYGYRVRAFNTTGPSGYSNTATAATVAVLPPETPSGLTATAVSSLRIDLTWQDNSTNEVNFEVERAPGGSGSWVLIATTAAGVTTHLDGGVAASTTYDYRVRAVNSAGASGYTNTATATTPAPAVVPPPPPDGLRNPGVQVLIAFDSKPTEAPVWTDVSAWVRAFSVNRGKSTELEPVQAGSGSLVLDNRDRRFDPSHVGGPYYGKLKKRKRARIRGTWAGATQDQFTAYAEDWPQRWEGPVESTVTVPLVDGLAILAGATVDAAYPAQRSDQRISDLLDDSTWTVGSGWLLGSPTAGVLGQTTVLGSPGDRLLSTGDALLVAEPAPGAAGLPVLAAAQMAEASERGLLYADKAGAIRFRSRHELQQQRITALDTFGDLGIGSSELPYSDLVVEAVGGPHYTRARVQWGTGGQLSVVSQDGAAVADYYPVTLTADTRLAVPEDAADLAAALVADYKEPAPRISAMVHAPALDPAALWPRLLARDLGDVVEVRRRPPGGGAVFAQRSRIEGIEMQYRAGDRTDTAQWSIVWRLSPVPAIAPWVLGDPVYSVLGSTTRLLY